MSLLPDPHLCPWRPYLTHLSNCKISHQNRSFRPIIKMKTNILIAQNTERIQGRTSEQIQATLPSGEHPCRQRALRLGAQGAPQGARGAYGWPGGWRTRKAEPARPQLCASTGHLAAGTPSGPGRLQQCRPAGAWWARGLGRPRAVSTWGALLVPPGPELNEDESVLVPTPPHHWTS